MEDDLQCRCQTENRPRCLWQNLSASQARHLSLKGEACSGVTDKQKDTRKGRPYGCGGRLVLSPLSSVPLIAVCLSLRKETHEKAGERSSPLRVGVCTYKQRDDWSDKGTVLGLIIQDGG